MKHDYQDFLLIYFNEASQIQTKRHHQRLLLDSEYSDTWFAFVCRMQNTAISSARFDSNKLKQVLEATMLSH